LTQLGPRKIACQPEPPWIKRCSYGVTFTDHIQTEDIEFNYSESERNGKKGGNETSEDGESRPEMQAVPINPNKHITRIASL